MSAVWLLSEGKWTSRKPAENDANGPEAVIGRRFLEQHRSRASPYQSTRLNRYDEVSQAWGEA
jgi:hypothetical protein